MNLYDLNITYLNINIFKHMAYNTPLKENKN